MFVAEIYIPGTLLNGVSQEVEALLELFIGGLQDAAVALEFYNQEKHYFLQQQIQQPERNLSRDVQREIWSMGTWPRAYMPRRQVQHARSFLYALDQIGKTLKKLEREQLPPTVTARIAELVRAWDDAPALRDLRGVRDSSHHPEDRMRMQDRHGKKISLKPISTGSFYAPNGMLTRECFSDDYFGSTMSDGHHGQVEVSQATLVAVQSIVQAVFQAPWEWAGHEHWEPWG